MQPANDALVLLTLAVNQFISTDATAVMQVFWVDEGNQVADKVNLSLGWRVSGTCNSKVDVSSPTRSCCHSSTALSSETQLAYLKL